MNIAVFGTGVVGQTIAQHLAENGHTVFVGTRSPERTLSISAPDMYGRPSFREWLAQNSQVQLAAYQEAAHHADVILNATNGTGSLPALEQAGHARLDGKILIDIANPLDFSKGMPPSLTVCNTDSLGEQIQRAFPEVKVVKALNTVTASLMVDPGQLAGGDHTLFICGDDALAKAQVSQWLTAWFGWRHILDLGDISAARGTEMYLPIWLRMWGALGTGVFNVKVVR